MSYPATLEEQQYFYEEHKRILGVNSLEEMRKLPVSAYDLVVAQLQPLGVMCCRVTTDDVHYTSSWKDFECSGLEIIVGDTAHEFTVFEGVALSINLGKDSPRISTLAFISNLKKVVAEKSLQDILDVYGIHPYLNNKDALDRLWQFVEDSTFAEPTERFASSAAAKGARVYRYLFDQVNPFGGVSHKRSANHSLELPYLYGPEGIFDSVENPSKEQKIASNMQYKWLQFAHGEKIWSPFDEKKYYVFGPEGETGEVDLDEFKKRRRADKWSTIYNLPFSDRWQLVVHCAKHAAEMMWDGTP